MEKNFWSLLPQPQGADEARRATFRPSYELCPWQEYLSLQEQYSFRIVLTKFRAICSNFSIPERKTSSCFSLGHFHFVQMPLAGIEPAFQPSQGRVLSIERQGRY